MLELINQFNSTENRQIIKQNLKRIMKEKRIKKDRIISLGYSFHNVSSWLNKANNNAPNVEQSLHIATTFDFDVRELLKIS